MSNGLLAQSVTADQGIITTDEEPMPCVRLTFHYGQGVPHGHEFMAHWALDRLIADLTKLRDGYMGQPDPTLVDP
jgi:hypothetical protein